MILFSDSHFDNHAEFAMPWRDGCNTRLRDQLDALEEVFLFARLADETVIVHLGDWFHKWKAVETPVKSMVTHVLFGLLDSYPEIHLVMLVGNHDMTHKSDPTINTLSAYGSHPQITVVDQPMATYVQGRPCVFVPYYEDFNLSLAHAIDLCPSNDARLFTHIDIVGAQAGIDGYQSRGGLVLDDLDCYAGGLFGHYHMPQDMLNHRAGGFAYVGSPIQLSSFSAGELNHGFVQLDASNQIVRHTLSMTPRFVKKTEDDNPSECREQDFHLVTCVNGDPVEVARKYSGLHSRMIRPKKKKEGKAILQVKENSDEITEYIRLRPPACELDLVMVENYGRYYMREDV